MIDGLTTTGKVLGLPVPVLLLLLGILPCIVVAYVFRKKKSSDTATFKGKMDDHQLLSIPSVRRGSMDMRDRCSILFGTQTGTAERFSKTLKSQLDSKYGANVAFDVIDLENYDFKERLPKEKMVFLLLATYGDGEPTDNAAEFYEWITGEAEDDGVSLDGISYGVFALGNRQYEHFCNVGKKVHKIMRKLGGTALLDVGKGDDDDDIDRDFDEWIEKLFEALGNSDLLKSGDKVVLTSDNVASYDVTEVVDAPMESVDILRDGDGNSAQSPHLATITEVRELHLPASDRSCIHAEIDISGCPATYEAGDHIAIYPENPREVVEAAAAALGLSLDLCFQLSVPEDDPNGLPHPPSLKPMTLRMALARYADLLSSPSKASIAALAAFATDPKDAARLEELASIEGREAFHTYISVAKRSLLEVMQEFPSARPTLGAFFGTIAPHLQPRYYSISSSPAMHPRSVHVTCAVVQETMPTGRIHNGVASTWLAKAKPGSKVPIFIRHSTFRMPLDASIPIVMVGPGTGLAPFRGFIQERRANKKFSKLKTAGECVLYFGCRRKDQDFIYQSELEEAKESGGSLFLESGMAGVLSSLYVAFSRQNATKDYVQHHMVENGEELWNLLAPPPLGKGGYFYVCGDAKNMAKDVHKALHDIVQNVTGCSLLEAESKIKEISASGRYLKDVW